MDVGENKDEDSKGISVDNWRNTIPEDIRNNKIIQETKDISAMAKRLVDANNFISKSIRIPDDGDTTGMEDLYNKLGRPKTVAEYKIKKPDLPEGEKYDEAIVESFLAAAHKIGLNSNQATALLEWNQEKLSEQKGQQKKSQADAASALKKEWGNAFDERVKIAEEVLNQYGDDESEAVIKNNPALINLIYKMGKDLVEGTVKGKSSASSQSRTPAEAQAEINKLMRDTGFKTAYFNKKDITHNAAVEQMKQLNAEAYPQQEAVVY